jgi:hypothetical protein
MNPDVHNATHGQIEMFLKMAQQECQQANPVTMTLSKQRAHAFFMMAVTGLANPMLPVEQVFAVKSGFEAMIDEVFRHDKGCRWTLRDALEKVMAQRSRAVQEEATARCAFGITYLAQEFRPFDPDPKVIMDGDIAHALSNLCRWGGHTTDFYSVAQHSVEVSRACPAECALEGLLHDAAEAYLVDLPAPLKGLPQFAFYRQAEAGVNVAIAQKFKLTYPWPEPVMDADKLILYTEVRDLLAYAPPVFRHQLGTQFPVLPYKIVPLDPVDAESLWLEEFDHLTELRDTAAAKKGGQ